jgi:tetratricopeptide (TPR) repeat protein
MNQPPESAALPQASEAVNPPPALTVSPSRRQAPGLLWAALALLGIALLGLGWYGWRWYTAPVPPDVPLDKVESVVAEAVRAARKQVIEDPWSGPAWGKLGMVLEAHEFIGQAEVCYARAEELDPDDRRWPYFLGSLQVRTNPQEGVRHLRRTVALSRGEEAFEPRLRLALALLDLDQQKEGEQILHDLLNERPNFFPIHLYLGTFHYRRQELRESLPYLRRATEGKATQKTAYSLLAQIYTRLGQPEEAARARYAETVVPEGADWDDPLRHQITELAVGSAARLRQITQLQDQDLFEESLPLLRDLVRDYPNDSRNHYRLGVAYFRLYDHDQAEKAFRKALELDPNSVKANFSLGRLLVAREDEKAKRFGKPELVTVGLRAGAPFFIKVIELKTDHAWAHFLLGELFRKEHKKALALARYQTALLCQLDFPEAHTGMAELYLAEGQDAEALSHIYPVLTLSRLDPKRLQLLARVISRSTLWK